MIFNFGGLSSPSLAESLSALYVIFVGLQLKDSYYKFIFILNGLTAAISHSPFMYSNYPKLRNYASYLDFVSIFYVLILYPLKSSKLYLFIMMILIDLLFNNLIYNLIHPNKLLTTLPSIVILYNRGFLTSYYNIIILIMALLMKYYENVELISNIKLHSIWHILGAHMFKEMIIL